MPGSPAENRYGQRGGGWLPELGHGEAPFGVVDGGRRQPCPEPVYVRCDCGYSWVVPSTAAKPCERCGESFTRVNIPRSA
jgi:hypothetical protein